MLAADRQTLAQVWLATAWRCFFELWHWLSSWQYECIVLCLLQLLAWICLALLTHGCLVRPLDHYIIVPALLPATSIVDTAWHCIALNWFLPRCSMQPVFPIAMVSVGLSQRELWQNERKFHRDSYTTWKINRTHRMVGVRRPLLPEILGRTARRRLKNGDFHSIFARSGSTVGASEKSSTMNNRSSVRAFQRA